MSSTDELAVGFVLEYLDRTPEYIDVAEFVDDNDTEEPSDDSIAEVYQKVIDYLDVICQRFMDEET